MNKYLLYFLLAMSYIAAAARDVVSKLVLAYLNPLALSAIVALLTVLTCLVIGLIQKLGNKDRPKSVWNRPNGMRLFVLSVVTVGAVYFANLAIELVGPVTYKVLEVTTYPVWVAAFMFVLLRQAVPKKDLLATGIALAGFLVFYANRFDQFQMQWLGIVAALASTVFYAASLVLAKSLLNNRVHPADLLAVRFLLLSSLILTVSPVEIIQLPPHILWYILGLGIVFYGLLITFMFSLMREVQPSTMAVFIAGAPIFSAVLAWLMIPGTRYTGLEMLGLAIIVAGLLVAVFIEEKPAKSVPLPIA